MKPRHLYSLGLYLLSPFVVIRLFWRSLRAPAYRSRIAERFGFVSPNVNNRPVIWVHAVSVGETLAAIPLIKRLQQQYPDCQLLVTTTTPTGSDRVKQGLGNSVDHVYFPYDLPGSVQRFLKRKKPVLAIIMETELWPNTLFACAQKNIHVVLANARLSEKSARGYNRFPALTREALENLACVAVQNQSDGERFLQLGLPKAKLQVTGSIKFDLEITEPDKMLAAQLRRYWSPAEQRKVLLAASTHPGEDEIILDVFSKLKNDCQHLLLVIVPRHPERFEGVFQLVRARDWKVAKRSSHELAEGSDASLASDIDVVIGDSMGEMLAFYGAADIAFVGGSFVPVGGHNLVEPAVWSLPILSGSHLHNFRELADGLLAVGGLVRCDSVGQLEESLRHFIHSEEACSEAGKKAFDFALENRGALAKLLSVIHALK